MHKSVNEGDDASRVRDCLGTFLPAAKINHRVLLEFVGMPNAGGLARQALLPCRVKLVEPACKRHGAWISQRGNSRGQALTLAQIVIRGSFLCSTGYFGFEQIRSLGKSRYCS